MAVVDFTPVVVDIKAPRGDDVSFGIKLKSDETTAIDLTGFTASAQMRSTELDTTVVATFTTTVDPDQTLAGNRGIVWVAVAAADTASLSPANFKWDLQLVSATSKKRTYVKGTFEVQVDTTRP